MEDFLLKRLKKEKHKDCLTWVAMALLHLNTSHTTELFDFLVEHENFGDAHLFPMFTRLNPDSLQRTAYARIESKNLTARIMAAQILSKTELNENTENLLLNAVKEWDWHVKGYAIYSIKELQIGNLLPVFKPLLDSPQTKTIALEAIANSPTEEDRQYLLEMVTKEGIVSKEILNSFYKSTRIENVKYWLELLSTKPIPEDYYFHSNDQPLLRDYRILEALQKALKDVKNSKILEKLVWGLEGRTDEESTRIMMNFLTHENSSVRYWSARFLKGNNSCLVVELLPKILRQPEKRVVSLTELVLENKLDTLHSIYETIYQSDQSSDWRRSSMEYFSGFPKTNYSTMFKSILEDESEDFYLKRLAALGLGRLKDENSVDLIVSACRKESLTSDHNAVSFLLALNMIKGNKAKFEIEKYKTSKERSVRDIVNEILSKW